MKLGCLGCLTSVVVGLLVVTLGGATLWVWAMTHATPPLLFGNHARADPVVVERRIAELGHRSAGQPSRAASLVLSEADVATFLGQYLDDAGVPISEVQTRLRTGEVIVQGRVPLGRLLEGAPVTWLPFAILQRSLDAPVWVTLTGTIAVHAAPSPRRPGYAEATLVDSRIGRLSIPSWLLTVMAGSRGASLLRWQVPPIVERMDVGDGRLTVRTR